MSDGPGGGKQVERAWWSATRVLSLAFPPHNRLEMAQERILGPYERFSLARSLVGVAPVVAFTALLPSSHPPVESAQVAQAVTELLARHPLLSCSVAGATTAQPRFRRHEVRPEDVLVESAETGRVVDEALLDALEAVKDAGVEPAPLWRVWLSGSDQQGRRRLTVAVHHVLSDGSSTRNLFAELLSLVRAPVPSSEKKTGEALSLAPTLEATVDVRPSTLSLVKVLFSEFVAPRLPSLFCPSPPTVFPNPPIVPPYLQQTALKHLALSPAAVARLKACARAHGIATLHPVLYIAALAALSNAAPPGTAIHGESPISLRDPAVGHPSIGGNYVCSLSTTHGAPDPRAPFWQSCAAYAARLADPDERAGAKGGMGMLAYVPDGPVEDEDGQQRTRFDMWMEEKLEAAEPWSASFEVSNLGVLPVTGWEGDGEEDALGEVYWAQAGMALGPALAINVRTCLR